MNTSDILKTIGERCNGDIYLGIVGPVRVGKSTFIKRFMEKAVIPYIKDEYEKARSIDELPQSGEGRTIMTTEPKFVPNQAATIVYDDGFTIKVRLVDCVGYVIPEAKGYKDDGGIDLYNYDSEYDYVKDINEVFGEIRRKNGFKVFEKPEPYYRK